MRITFRNLIFKQSSEVRIEKDRPALSEGETVCVADAKHAEIRFISVGDNREVEVILDLTDIKQVLEKIGQMI